MNFVFYIIMAILAMINCIFGCFNRPSKIAVVSGWFVACIWAMVCAVFAYKLAMVCAVFAYKLEYK